MKKSEDNLQLVYAFENKEGSYQKGTIFEIPEGYYLVIYQNEVGYFGPIEEEKITLDNNYFPELIFEDDDTAFCLVFLIKKEIEIEHAFDNCVADLNKGYPLNFSFKLKKTKFIFSEPNVLLDHLFAFHEETNEGIYFYKSNILGFIELTILKEIEETLLLQSFFNPENGAIEYESLSNEHQKFMDYISDLEVTIEGLFEQLGIEVLIELENFETVCPVDEFYIQEA